MESAIKDIEKGWKTILTDELRKDYFVTMVDGLKSGAAEGKVYYPPPALIFNAFNTTPWDEVKVVILGQDPYHNPGEAMGLCFSVPQKVKVPPSLKNIYKEMNTDLGIEIAQHGDLSHWAQQGVFLLNAILTVEHKSPGSHRKIGWQKFTDRVITLLSEKKEGLVFMLWGNFAKNKKELIDTDKHLVLEAAHPSPLARGAYFGSKHFSQANHYLTKHNKTTVDWKI